MKLGRILLIAVGLAFTPYGFLCLFSPQSVADYTGMVLPNASALNEVAAMYGGLQIGLGLIFIVLALRKQTLAMGLIILMSLLGALALGRLYGLFAYGFSTYNVLAVIFEAVSAGLAMAALKQFREEEALDAK
ncbi:MAG: DUF4345 family protein [Myxococcota bacterium]|nr:DUF4345 family protein [Myxococcota bacterium]